MNKTKEILMFLLIFGLVSNALNLLSISATDYSEGSMDEDLEDIQTIAAMYDQVTLTVGVAIVGAIIGFVGGTLLGMASFGGLDPIKVAGFTAFGGLLTGTLVPTLGIVQAISKAVPAEGQMGFTVVGVIFLGTLSILLVYNFVEMTLGVKSNE